MIFMPPQIWTLGVKRAEQKIINMSNLPGSAAAFVFPRLNPDSKLELKWFPFFI